VIRTIRTTGQGRSQAVADAIEAVLVSEVLAPSAAFWLVSPWLSDLLVIDNADGRFTGLTTLPRRHISLIEALQLISAPPGAAISVVTREEPTNAAVLAKLRRLQDEGTPIRLVIDHKVHDKAMLTDRVLLSGSMNFTIGGTEHNTESLTITADSGQVGATHVQFADLYGAPR
jgi:phosphatidylserine/phosphatidylglycerophosphate/cardiolipin synthase-like enzyme